MTFRCVYSDTLLVKFYHFLLVGITAIPLFFHHGYYMLLEIDRTCESFHDTSA
jgi:hypothetical protein